LAENAAEDLRGLTGEQVLHYGCDDALMSSHLWKLFDLVTSLEGVNDFYIEKETATVHVLNTAFETGVKVDYERMRELQEIDKETAHHGMITIRNLLRENCGQEVEAHATAFFEADYETLRVKTREKGAAKGWSKEKINAELECIRLGYITNTMYHDYEVVKPSLDFSATPTTVNKVIATVFPGDELKLKSLSGSAITDFLVQAPPVCERSEKFCDLLATHAKQLNKAKQFVEELQEFNSFCAGVLVEKMSPVAVGDELNLGSPKQLAGLLYLKLGLPVRERTQKTKGSFRDINGLPGTPSTDETSIKAALLFDCPEGDWRRTVLKTILDVKEAITREGLFYKPYPLWAHPRDGLMHPQFRNCGTVTRRPAGSSPNLLQVSKGNLRTIFIPRHTGHVLIPIDFSGQELRLTGSESKDPTLISCYMGGGTWTDEDGMIHPVTKDVHSVTSAAFATDVLMKTLGKEVIAKCLLDSTGFVNYDWFRKVYKWEAGRDSLIDELGDLTPDFSKVFEKVRDMAKVVNFLIIYGGNHFTLARKLGITEEFAERLMTLVFKSYARLAPWQEETIEYAEKFGYVQTAYGTRRHVTDAIMSRDGGAKSRMERQAVNSTIQGCLQASSLVSTDRGLIPIQELVGEVFEADTGFGFFTSTAVNMGRSTAARITTSSGLVVNCDVRHKVKNDRREWVEFPDLAVGDFIALPKLADSGFSTDDYHIDWDFIVGYWMGDGSLNKRKGSRPTDTHRRSTLTLVGGVKKKPLLDAIYAFFMKAGLSPTRGETVKPGYIAPVYRVVLNRKADIEVVEAKGVTTEKARTKRIPQIILSGSQSTREQFLRGFLLADGARTVGYRVHTPNDLLLSDLQVLAGTLGMDSGKFQTKEAGYVEFSGSYRRKRRYPFESLLNDVEAVNGVGFVLPCSRGDNESITNRRGYQAGVVTQPVAERILAKHTQVDELYRFDRVVKLEVFDYEVDTYTLSVDHPLHQFVADGVIHKNCAADILKLVFNSAYETKLFEETKSVLIAPVYDEVLASVPVHHAVEYIFRAQQIMNVTPPGHAIPMMAEVSIGRNWCDQEELGDNPSEKKIEAAIERAFAA
jgi:DNA polymerase I-like protein with 3'-5' exonuclease and polymerase domains